jgi:Tol biopolymer transport system component
VFDSRREGSGDLYLISPDGGTPRLLAGGPGYQGEPRWSKDGRWIYFHTGGQRGQLFKIPAQGGSPLQLTREGGGPARESPDGRRIYYGKGGGLWKMSAAGGEETQVLQGLSWPTNFAVTTGGIYYIPGDPARFGDQPLRIEFHDFVTSSARLVLQTGGLWHLGLSISPDNRWIAFSQFDQVGGDILLVENFQ